ncbi:hypothetical protein Tco_1394616 [Tanacetum coccineum]
MAQENYVEGCYMQRPPLLEPNGFCFWKACFKTYVKSKDIDLWQVIQNGDFYFEVEDSETKLIKETPYKLLRDNAKKQLGKNEEAKMTIYNTLPCKEAKVTTIEEAKDLASLPHDELVAKVIIEQTSDDSDSQEGSDKDINEEEAEAFNLLARNFRKGNRLGRGIRFGNGGNRFGKGRSNNFEDKGESRRRTSLSWEEHGAIVKTGMNVKNDTTCLMAIESQEVNSLKCNVSKLQDEELNFLKFKESSIALDDMISHQNLSQDKEGLGFSKNDKTTSIVDSGCTKHMTGNRRLVTSYKAYDGGHVVFGSNLKGKVIGEGNITHDSITITNVEHVSGLAFSLISIVLNKETMRIKESLNVTFDESLPKPKSSSLVKDDRIDEPIVQDLNGSPSLQVNVLDEGYPKSLNKS